MTTQRRSPLHTLAFRTIALARPLAGRRWFRLWGILEHRGRTSGRTYRTPVVMQPSGESVLIPIPFGEGTQWVRNVLAAGEATVVWGGRRIRVGEPAIVGRDDADPSFNALERAVMDRSGIVRFMRLRPAG